MSSFEELDAQWGECWLEAGPLPDDLAAAIRRQTGGVIPGWASRLSTVPWVVRAFFGGIEKKIAHMPTALWDLIAFVVSQDNACRYCYGATRTVLRILGYADEAIDRLERDIDLADLTTAEKAALQFARKLSQANPLPEPADFDALAAAGFSNAELRELAFTAAFAGYANRVATLFALPPDQLEHILDSPFRRLIRPLIARQFRGRRHPVAALPVPNDPPFASLIAKLEGSPTAHSARRIVDEALGSPVLPRRTKLLVFAVIGRALGSTYVESEARTALAAERFPVSDLDEVILNLGSPKLDERERILVPFARETVRYRNLAIQQRTRALADRLRAEEIIEAVGVAGLANSIGRLAVLVDSC